MLQTQLQYMKLSIEDLKKDTTDNRLKEIQQNVAQKMKIPEAPE